MSEKKRFTVSDVQITFNPQMDSRARPVRKSFNELLGDFGIDINDIDLSGNCNPPKPRAMQTSEEALDNLVASVGLLRREASSPVFEVDIDAMRRELKQDLCWIDELTNIDVEALELLNPRPVIDGMKIVHFPTDLQISIGWSVVYDENLPLEVGHMHIEEKFYSPDRIFISQMKPTPVDESWMAAPDPEKYFEPGDHRPVTSKKRKGQKWRRA